MKNILFLFLLIVVSSCGQKTYEIGQIKTPKGEISIWLHDETPNHKKSFIELANKGYWDNFTFN